MNQAMSGTCGVGVVLVNGPAGSAAAFTQGEIIDISAGLTRGWDVLYRLSANSPVRPKLLFTADYRFVTLAVDPATVPFPTAASPGSSDYSAREPLWRDPALKAMGYGSGTSGIASYNSDLLKKAWSVGTATSAYTVFITKYSAAWMAYTDIASAYMVLQYPWLSGGVTAYPGQGWGNSWPMAYAHETGHIFQAPDEYLKSKCSRTSLHGALHIPNANCERTATDKVFPCLMLHNTENVCSPTVRTWGWVDDNKDGVLDVTP